MLPTLQGGVRTRWVETCEPSLAQGVLHTCRLLSLMIKGSQGHNTSDGHRARSMGGGKLSGLARREGQTPIAPQEDAALPQRGSESRGRRVVCLIIWGCGLTRFARTPPSPDWYS